jgi:hypothetical protein
MRSASNKTCAGMLMVLVTALAYSMARAEEAPPPETTVPEASKAYWSEKIGFELSGFALLFGRGHESGDGSDLLYAGPSLFLRGPTRRWDKLTWTTFELGGGLFYRSGEGMSGFHAAIGTEFGYVMVSNETIEAQLGLGLLGGILLKQVGGDYSSDVGGWGLILSPTLGVRTRSLGKVTLGVTARMLLPTMTFKAGSVLGVGLLIALDIGIR